MSTLNVYVGHDEREQLAYEVCEHSIKTRSCANVIKLSSKDIPEYVREYNLQSTDFTYTRFLVPYLNNYKGYAVFCDCDFLFLDDINKLLKYINLSKAVSVVKHPRYIPNSEIKMDNIIQVPYNIKNWSSLMVFNCEHKDCLNLTPYSINVAPGSYLHQLQWTRDENIGSIPLDWNCLDDYYFLDNPKAIHYTDGGPWFEGYKNTTYSKLWIKEYNDITFDIISQ